ncbi:MAG: hypothetical protein ABIR91_02875 [Candidatus Saccharimonadales bacterium]
MKHNRNHDVAIRQPERNRAMFDSLRQSHPWPTAVAAMAALAVSLGASAGGIQPASPHETASTLSVEAVEDTMPLNTLRVIVVQQPASAEIPSKYSNEDIIREIDDAGVRIARSTGGKHSTPADIPITTVVAEPKSTIENLVSLPPIEPCFSLDEVHDIRTGVLKKEQLPRNSRTAVIIDQGTACNTHAGPDDPVVALAWYSSREGSKTTVFNDFTAPIFSHEFGHSEGLPHSESLLCRVVVRSPIRNLDPRDTVLPQDVLCESKAESTRRTLAVNGSQATVMSGVGDRWNDSETDIFTSNELNIIAPEVSKKMAADITIAQTYKLSVEKDALRMVTIDLPPEHPLKGLDPSLTQLTVGITLLSWTEGKRDTIVRVSAVGPERSYQYDFISKGLTSTFEHESVLLVDPVLNIQISMQRAANEVDALVSIEPLLLDKSTRLMRPEFSVNTFVLK